MTIEQILNIHMRGVHIPHHMVEGTLRYFNDHIKPGDFLTAVLENNFMMACSCADSENIMALPAWGALLYNLAPRGTYGSPENVAKWLALRDCNKENLTQ